MSNADAFVHPIVKPVPRLILRNVCKQYASIRASDQVSLTVQPGEIHALLGENGAGKSTLMKIIYGAIQADSGEVFWEGKAVRIANPAAARQLGIGMVFQHFSLFETLTVGENIALALPGQFERGTLDARIVELSADYGLDIDPRRMVSSLTVGERQRVEIVRCLLQKPRLLIMDEPTSVLTPQAVQQLFNVLRRLAREGCSILYISHKLDEIQDLCHTATVLRGGRVIGSVDPRQASQATLAQLMVGHALPAYNRRESSVGPVALSVRDLSVDSAEPFASALQGVSFDVHCGEIFGIAGVSGNGQAQLLSALSGEWRGKGLAADNITLCGQPAADLSVEARRALGFAYVPEERLGRGAVPSMTLAENGLLTGHRQQMVQGGWLRESAIKEFAEYCIERFDVRCGGSASTAQSLSGGNLQKFIVGREIDSPTL